jgi:hypothetical protein
MKRKSNIRPRQKTAAATRPATPRQSNIRPRQAAAAPRHDDPRKSNIRRRRNVVTRPPQPPRESNIRARTHAPFERDAPVVTQIITVGANATFDTSIFDPGGITEGLGVRIETPVNRAIAAYWVPGTLSLNDDGDAIWTATQVAPVDIGAYNLVWRSNAPEPPEFEGYVPLNVVDPATLPDGGNDWPEIDVDSITPTVDDVAVLERSRCQDASGNDMGTFTETTSPAKDTDVEKLITQAIEDVMAHLPDAINPDLYPRAKRAVTLQAAILLETSFFRVQGMTPEGRGAAGQSSNVFTYRTMLNDILTELQTSASPDEDMRLV